MPSSDVPGSPEIEKALEALFGDRKHDPGCNAATVNMPPGPCDCTRPGRRVKDRSILRDLYREARVAAHEQDVRLSCHFCGNDHGLWEPVSVRLSASWWHPLKDGHDDACHNMPCAAGAIWDALSKLKAEGR